MHSYLFLTYLKMQVALFRVIWTLNKVNYCDIGKENDCFGGKSIIGHITLLQQNVLPRLFGHKQYKRR